MDNKIQIFKDKRIRTAWNEESEEWYFSVSDVVEILTDSKEVKQYIKKMRSRDAELNSKWVQFVPLLKRLLWMSKN